MKPQSPPISSAILAHPPFKTSPEAESNRRRNRRLRVTARQHVQHAKPSNLGSGSLTVTVKPSSLCPHPPILPYPLPIHCTSLLLQARTHPCWHLQTLRTLTLHHTPKRCLQKGNSNTESTQSSAMSNLPPPSQHGAGGRDAERVCCRFLGAATPQSSLLGGFVHQMPACFGCQQHRCGTGTRSARCEQR